MEQPLTAVYDANILYPAPLRDLFIRLGQYAQVLNVRFFEFFIPEGWQKIAGG